MVWMEPAVTLQAMPTEPSPGAMNSPPQEDKGVCNMGLEKQASRVR